MSLVKATAKPLEVMKEKCVHVQDEGMRKWNLRMCKWLTIAVGSECIGLRWVTVAGFIIMALNV